MFEPNSIRSLLSKRKSARAQSGKQQQNTKDTANTQNGLDPDYQTVIEAKLLKKEIQDKIQSIREWRKHQQQLTKQKLKFNAQLSSSLNFVHLKNLEKQAQRYQQELKGILCQLDKKTQIKIDQNQQMFDSERIFNVLTETDNLRQKLKSQNVQFKKQQKYEQLVSQMDQMNHIFTKQKIPETTNKNQTQIKKIDAELLKKQMEQIDNQLKEIQELLADQPKNKNQTNKVNKY